ncbi:hypothetical protein GCM10027296_23240 [Chitinimonas naiadis]
MKPLKDIRYFECTEVPGPGREMPGSSGALIAIPKTAAILGQRIACLLEAEGFSVGAYDHVYIAFTPSLPVGEVVPTDFGYERWQRYTAYGLPADFNALSDEAKYQRIQDATFEVLAALRPEDQPILAGVRARLEADGERTRILRASKDTKAYRFEVWFDIPRWRSTAHLYVLARDKASGTVLAAPPFPLKDYEDVFPLVAGITFVKEVLTLKPRPSFNAGLSTRHYATPIQFPLSAFVPLA